MRADLHIHTVHSGDADQTVEQVLARAKELGLGAVAISDHNSLGGAREALEMAEGIIVLPAMEITSEEGHILAYGLESEVKRDLPVQETIDRIHENGGIAVAPHPYRIWSGLGERAVREANFDAVETLNGRSLDGANRRARVLARELGLPVTGGSDAHSIVEVGRAYTVFPDSCNSAEEMMMAIVDGRTSSGGESRSVGESFSYGRKCIGQWMGRGMKRL